MAMAMSEYLFLCNVRNGYVGGRCEKLLGDRDGIGNAWDCGVVADGGPTKKYNMQQE